MCNAVLYAPALQAAAPTVFMAWLLAYVTVGIIVL